MYLFSPSFLSVSFWGTKRRILFCFVLFCFVFFHETTARRSIYSLSHFLMIHFWSDIHALMSGCANHTNNPLLTIKNR